MSNFMHDIDDDQIRIISSESRNFELERPRLSEPPSRRRKKKSLKWLWFGLIILIGLIVILSLLTVQCEREDDEILEITTEPQETAVLMSPVAEEAVPEPVSKGYVEISDTIINNEKLTILLPVNTVPRLHVGADALEDTTARLVLQAADIRRDNHGIVGAYVLQGNLLSKGQAKAGFCAIINGKLTIGVADSTPYFEQAIESDGDFFRQYPLVVGGQVVENKLKPSSLRKALAELNGETVVVMTHTKMTLNEFSQLLVDLGVTNAIYLVGSSAFGFAVDKDGARVEFGRRQLNPLPTTNYIVWR